ncbi:zinc-binding dehydrogenase [Lentzea atacamensis]|uniref:zinc-binding dehydrogenase n=1 Tax=Lentzea atacamensis TaxID=531938 RepID=UPI001B86CECC|nr:zinc-binding dehydrogenase [Lentzea atacamensis]
MAEPVVGAGEVLIRVVATSINPVDDKTRQGIFGIDASVTLGWDLAGVVIGGELPVGERVIAMSHQLGTGRGTWADVVVLPVGAVVRAPESVSLVEAATLPLAGLTALQTLDWLEVGAGERLLVAGAAGAVGGIAVQVAAARGVRVDALVSREGQQVPGAELVTTDPRALTGYDAVFDTYGAFVLGAVVEGGRYASIASQAGVVPEVDGVRTANIQVREDGAGLGELVRLVDDGVVGLRVDSTFAIRDVRAAHDRFGQRGLSGKVAMVF